MALDKEAATPPLCEKCEFHDIRHHGDQVFDICNNTRWSNKKIKMLSVFDCDEERSTTEYNACRKEGIHFKQRPDKGGVYCKDCGFCGPYEEKRRCKRTRVVENVDLVEGPYETHHNDLICEHERYPDIHYISPDEQPCGREGKYFEPKEKA